MRPEPIPVAARPLARHSDALIKRKPMDGPRGGISARVIDERRVATLGLAGQRIARELGPRLARLLGGETPMVTSVAPRAATGADLAAIAGPLAGNSLFAAVGGAVRFIASVEAVAVLRLLDRTFGGRGDLPSPLPSALPLSSQLLIERLELATAGALAAALDLAGDPPVALRRDGDLAQIVPFAGDEALCIFRFDIAEAGAKPWPLTLAFAEAAIGVLFDSGASMVDDEAPVPHPSRGDPRIGPFAEMPMPLTATLIDMAMPLARLARLRIGDVLPVAVARSVPLHLGGKTIARGSIGALDDRVAVQISEAFR